MGKIIWTERSKLRLREIYDYISKDSHEIAPKFVLELIEKAASLERFSKKGRIVPELNQPLFRELLWKKYRIIYEIVGEEIWIVTILHQSQRFKL